MSIVAYFYNDSKVALPQSNSFDLWPYFLKPVAKVLASAGIFNCFLLF